MNNHLKMKSPCCKGTDLYLRVGIDMFDVEKGSFDMGTSKDMSLVCSCGIENIDWGLMIEENADSISTLKESLKSDTKVGYFCDNCDSSNIYRESVSSWSVADGEWQIDGVNNYICNNCGRSNVDPVERDANQASVDSTPAV